MGWTEIVVTAGLGVVASVVIAFVTARLTARQELRGWRRELAEKYASLVIDEPAKAQALARQHALGVLILETGDADQREKVFIAPFTRLTAGRAADNELVLTTPASSKRHFAVSADGEHAYVEDLGSANGTFLNDRRVSGRTLLRDHDKIRVDDHLYVEFQALKSA